MSSKYAEAGVNIHLGDECSRIAYEAAKSTFPSRKNLIGKPIVTDGGFSGMMDFGDFYLVQNNDTVGTKTQIAHALKKYDTLGYDLLAMVADDAVCMGAEVVSISNTIEISKVDEKIIKSMMTGLAKACNEQKIIIPGGEIAEMSSMVNGILWDATAIGIVKKDKIIDSRTVQSGDTIIGLISEGFRSNGFSLVRQILKDTLGENWHHEKFNNKYSWGEVTLTPCQIYHNAVLEVIGRYGEQAKAEVKGIAHITGGGLPGNITRVFDKKKFGVRLDRLPKPYEAMLRLQDMHTIKDAEAYEAWNMGIGMIIIAAEKESEKIINILEKQRINAQIIGEITAKPGVEIISQGYFETGKVLKFPIH